MTRYTLSLALLTTSLIFLPACWWRKKTEICDTYDTNYETCADIKANSDWETDEYETSTEPLNEQESIERRSIFDDEDGTEIELVESVSMHPIESELPAITEEITQKQKIGTLYFDFDRYTIRHDQKAEIRTILQIIKDRLEIDPALRIIIKGHACDSAGSYRYNLQLSDYRAQTIKSYLNEQGIAENKLEAFGCGTEELIVPFGTREEQAPNRRVEVFLAR